ncbi:MAG: PilZ domain-containing protein [Proteobacteria bacterium]|nr:MAG: PilZ domain-containing protein [Pseudomonadota bacterium]
MGKVIDITGRVRSQNSSLKAASRFLPSDVPTVLDMNAARQEMMNRERRDVKRTILTEFVGASVVLPERGLMKVALYDISDNGIAFDLEPSQGMFLVGEEIAVRIYLNHKTYFPFTVVVSNSRLIEDEGVIRHGSQFLKETMNDVALHHFVKFIESVSATLCSDNGDILVSNIS